MARKRKGLCLLVIDTEQYAGNFERDMCAYATGQIGECGVGDDQAEIARREIPEVVDKIEEIIAQVADDNGCHRPCEIYPTSGFFNNGMGGEFREGQEVEALKHYKKATREYYQGWINRIKGYGSQHGWTDEAKKRDIARHLGSITEAESLTKTPKGPAYLSVAIYFDERPSDEIIQVVKERSAKFAEGKKLTITGYRLIEQKVSSRETAI